MLNFNCATGSFFPEHKLRRWANLTIDLPRHIVCPWTASLISSLCRTHGSNNFLFHHSVDLMSSPISYIFSKPLDKCVVIVINIPRSSKISIEFLMRNSILCPRWFGLSSTTLFHSLQHKTCSCFMLYLEFLAIQLMLCSTLEYCYLLCQECHGKFSTLKNSWYKWYLLTSPFLFLVLVLFLTRIPTNGLWCVNSKLLATLLLWSYWSIVSFYVYGLLNYHSNIDCAA